jgi:PAS domain S-box-containing protein
MAVPTAIGFILLGTSLLLTRPNIGLTRVITSDTQSGAIARRLALIISIALMGVEAGWYDTAAQASLAVILFSALLFVTMWQAAKSGIDSEIAARTANEATQEARDRLQAIFNSAADGILISGLDGSPKQVNAAAARMLGYSAPEEVIGRHVTDLIRREDAGRLSETKEKQLHGDVEFGEWLIRKKDGSDLPIEPKRRSSSRRDDIARYLSPLPTASSSPIATAA